MGGSKACWAFFSYSHNLGDLTRALETAKALKEQDADVKFFNHGGIKLDMIKHAGIESIDLKPEVRDEQHRKIMEINQFRAPIGTVLPFTEEELKAMVEADINALNNLKPDGVYCGLNFSALIAAPYLKLPTVTQLPTTLCPSFYEMGLGRMPHTIERNFITRYLLPGIIKKRFFNSVMLKKVMKKSVVNYNRVRKYYGLKPVYNPIDFARCDLNLLPDLPELSGLPAEKLPEGYHYTGPIFAMMKTHLPREVHNIYSQKGSNVFFSLGSSGTPEVFLKIAQYLKGRKDLNTVCATTSIVKPGDLGKNTEHFFATDYVPAQHVNLMANFAITHGGAGTVQNAAWCGTPVIGIGFQAEQQANIDGLVRAGMGIRLKIYDINKGNLEHAIEEIQKSTYKENAKKVQEVIRHTDGVAQSVKLMNQLVQKS